MQSTTPRSGDTPLNHRPLPLGGTAAFTCDGSSRNAGSPAAERRLGGRPSSRRLRAASYRPLPLVSFAASLVLFALIAAAGFMHAYLHLLAGMESFADVAVRPPHMRPVRVEQARHVEASGTTTLAQPLSALYEIGHAATGSAPARATAPDIVVAPARTSARRCTHRRRTFPWSPMLWPVRGAISSPFGERIDPLDGEDRFHPGLDIASRYGAPVHATAKGRVQFAGIIRGYGRTVIIDHGHGFRTLYAHLSRFATRTGRRVLRGQVLGFVGLSGRTTGAHLHYEVRRNDSPVNPSGYLRAGS